MSMQKNLNNNYHLYLHKSKEYERLSYDLIAYLDLLLDNDLKPSEKAYTRFKTTYEELQKLSRKKKDRV